MAITHGESSHGELFSAAARIRAWPLIFENVAKAERFQRYSPRAQQYRNTQRRQGLVRRDSIFTLESFHDIVCDLLVALTVACVYAYLTLCSSSAIRPSIVVPLGDEVFSLNSSGI